MMGKGLEGKKIVIAGSRKTEEMSTIIEKQGGIPLVRSLQGTVFLAEESIEKPLRTVIEEGADWFLFTTGMGTETLVGMAEELGIKEEFLNRVKEAKIGTRGYKTFSALKKLHIKVKAVDEDGTTAGLIRALEGYSFKGEKVVVQLHGEKAPRLIQSLESQGATVLELLPYEHIAPEKSVVEMLCREIIEGKIDAVCFTTAIQVRALFDVAKEIGMNDRLRACFGKEIVAGAVGKITAEACREEGIENIVVPEKERMGALIIELGEHYKK
jgi:uroporphyrinogen-III synthase